MNLGEMINLNRPDITLEEDWVVVDNSKEVHHFKTFKEALESKIKGHLMTKQFYTYSYATAV